MAFRTHIFQIVFSLTSMNFQNLGFSKTSEFCDILTDVMATTVDPILNNKLQIFEKSESVEDLNKLRIELETQVKHDVETKCSVGRCSIFKIREIIVMSAALRYAALVKRKVFGLVPQYSTAKKYGVGFTTLLMGAVSAAVLSDQIIKVINDIHPAALEPAKSVINALTGAIFGATAFVIVDALSSNVRAVVGRIITVQEVGKNLTMPELIANHAIDVQARANQVDSRAREPIFHWGTALGYIIPTLQSISFNAHKAKLEGKGADYFPAARALASLLVNIKISQIMIDPSNPLITSLMAGVIRETIKPWGIAFQNATVGYIAEFYESQLKTKPTDDDIKGYYIPFIKKLMEPEKNPGLSDMEEALSKFPNSWFVKEE